MIPNWGSVFQHRPDYPSVKMEQVGLGNARAPKLIVLGSKFSALPLT